MLDLDAVIEADERALWGRLGGEVIIRDPRDGSFLSLEGAGARLWEMARSRVRLREAASAFALEHGAPADEVERDLLELAGALLARGLVRRT